MSEESKMILIYYYLQEKGDWSKIYSDACDKKEIDPEDMKKVISEKESDGFVFTTILDEEYPSYLRKVKRPPFVIMHNRTRGCDNPITVLQKVNKDEINLTGVENEENTFNYLRSHPLFIAKIDENVINIWKGDEKEPSLLGSIYCFSKVEAVHMLPQICNQVLAVTCEVEFQLVVVNALQEGRKIFACPGNSGCQCNRLIKAGACLCDTWEDLKKEDPIEEPRLKCYKLEEGEEEE